MSDPGSELLARLDDPSSAVRARAALRLGWMQHPEAAMAILAKIPDAVDELCSFVDALGLLGDPIAIPVVREIAGRKLLSRRRSGVEALYRLEDAKGLKTAHDRALSELPENVRTAVEDLNATPETIAESFQHLAEPKRTGLYLDTLYELADPESNVAIRLVLDEQRFDQPFIWRYVKSLLKRTILRSDFAMFGWLANRVERQSRKTIGRYGKVKSGYDGTSRVSPIFRRKTQRFLLRANWRYLRKLAHYEPENYPFAAAEALIAYSPEDAQTPMYRAGRFAYCYLFNQILYGDSARLELDDRRLRFLFRSQQDTNPPAGVREESYPELWDESPRAYLRVLSAAKLIELHEWAIAAVKLHPGLLQEATPDELMGMLAAPHQETVTLGLNELHRRFDPQDPDWDLLDALIADDRTFVLEIARDWLAQTAPLWVGNIERSLAWLQANDPETREVVLHQITTHLTEPHEKQRWADWILELLGSPASENLDTPLRLARWVLLDEFAERLSPSRCLQLIADDHPAIQGLGAAVLVKYADVYSVLSPAIFLALAEHETAAVRRAAQSLLLMAEADVRANPHVLFTLVESEWDDNRGLAARLLKEWIDWSSADIEQLMGLLDSNRVDVQTLGQQLAERHIATVDAGLLVNRLTEHSHPHMRRFAMRMVEEYLPNSALALEAVAEFFRKGLLETWPDRSLKNRLLDFLTQRGEHDRGQAVIACRILEEALQSQTQIDFELAVTALTQLQLAHPDLTTALRVMEQSP